MRTAAIDLLVVAVDNYGLPRRERSRELTSHLPVTLDPRPNHAAMAHQQRDHHLIEEDQSHLRQHVPVPNALDEQGLQFVLQQQRINPLSSQEFAYNDFPPLSFDQGVNAGHTQQ